MRKVNKKIVIDEPVKMSKPARPKNRKWPDYLLWFAATALSVVFCLFLQTMGMLTLQILISVACVLLLTDLICLVLILRRTRPRWTRWIMRIFLVVLCAALAFGNYTLYSTWSTLNAITSNTGSVLKMLLVTRADENMNSLDDLAKKKIGYSTVADATATGAALAEINTAVNSVEYVDDSDYSALYESLMNGDIDAMLIPSSRLTLLEEQFDDAKEQVKVIQTFETRRQSSSSLSSTLDISKEPFVVYIAGIDGGEDPSEDGRADTNILLMVDPVNNHMTTVSIPRDSFVPNPALNNGSDKLTHLGNDGAENSLLGLEEAFGIEIDYYAKVNFQSLIQIVDTLGGITVDVQIDFTEQDENRSFKKKDLITLEKGVQLLNGKQALAYARHRKTAGYGTTGRENAQQQIIKAIMEKLTTAEGIACINDLMAVAQEHVATDIPLTAIQQFVSRQLQDVKPWTVDSITLNSGVDATLTTVSMPSMPLSCYLLSAQDITKVFNAYASMFDTSKMKDFTFDLSSDPDLTVDYNVREDVSEYMITAADYSLLSPYSVYYGIDRVDSSRAAASENSVETYNIQMITPTYSEPAIFEPVETPVIDSGSAEVPEQPIDPGTDTGGTDVPEPETPDPAPDPGITETPTE